MIKINSFHSSHSLPDNKRCDILGLGLYIYVNHTSEKENNTMNYMISGKNIDVTEGLKQAIYDKLGRLEKFFTDVDTSDLTQYSNEIKELAIPAINTIMQRLNIDIKEL